MPSSFQRAAAAVLTFAATTALAQDNAAVVFDATSRNAACMIEDVTDPHSAQVCGANSSRMPFFLVQGQKNKLRVINRKFLTAYSFYIYQVTPIKKFPIEGLKEAANLNLSAPSAGPSPVSKGATPKGLATSGALQLRTAQDLIAELLNPGTASNPVNEFASDWIVVRRELENVHNDANGFLATWHDVNDSSVLSQPPLPDSAIPIECLTAYGAPTLVKTLACLHGLNLRETTGSFDWATSPYTDEDAFQKLIDKVNDAIKMVNLLGPNLAQQVSVLNSDLSAFDGDLASARADLNTLAGNSQALQDAQDLLGSIHQHQEITRDQIRARIMQQYSAGSKPVLDDAEINILVNEYYSFVNSPKAAEVLRSADTAIDTVWLRGEEQIREAIANVAKLIDETFPTPPFFPREGECSEPPYVAPDATHQRGAILQCLAARLDARYSYLLEEAHRRFGETLPEKIAEINAAQSNLLNRANQIYDNSQVSVPKDLLINPKGNGGALGFAIYETQTFPRFAIPSNNSPTTAVISAAPLTIQPAQPAAPQPSGSTNTPGQPSGTDVADGLVDVHERYKATMVAAFAFSPNLKERSVQSIPVTSGMTSDSTTNCSTSTPCSQAVLARGSAHTSVILGMSYHPWGYDTFPRAYKGTGPIEHLKHAVGIFGGLSVVNLNDYYGGIDFQIAHGIQFQGGVNFFRTDALAQGYKNGNVYAGTPTFAGPQQFKSGAYFGLGLNLPIFRKAFGWATGLGTKSSSTGS